MSIHTERLNAHLNVHLGRIKLSKKKHYTKSRLAELRIADGNENIEKTTIKTEDIKKFQDVTTKPTKHKQSTNEPTIFWIRNISFEKNRYCPIQTQELFRPRCIRYLQIK